MGKEQNPVCVDCYQVSACGLPRTVSTHGLKMGERVAPAYYEGDCFGHVCPDGFWAAIKVLKEACEPGLYLFGSDHKPGRGDDKDAVQGRYVVKGSVDGYVEGDVLVCLTDEGRWVKTTNLGELDPWHVKDEL